MKVNAWIQMGCERRDVTFEVTNAEIQQHWENLEQYIEVAVIDWVDSRYGWGWSCDMFSNDFTCLEDGDAPSFVITAEELNPATRSTLVHPRNPLGLRSDDRRRADLTPGDRPPLSRA